MPKPNKFCISNKKFRKMPNKIKKIIKMPRCCRRYMFFTLFLKWKYINFYIRSHKKVALSDRHLMIVFHEEKQNNNNTIVSPLSLQTNWFSQFRFVFCNYRNLWTAKYMEIFSHFSNNFCYYSFVCFIFPKRYKKMKMKYILYTDINMCI